MIKGIIPMTYCFFNKNNTIDIKLMSDQISLIKQLGSNGIACLGLATEAVSYTHLTLPTILRV